MEASEPTPERISLKDRLRQKRYIVGGLIAIIAVLLIAYGAYAATAPKTKQANIIIHTTLVDSSGKSPLNGVRIALASPDGGSCGNGMAHNSANQPDISKKGTPATDGIAVFTGCSTGSRNKRYVIKSAQIAGYEVRKSTPHPLNTGFFHAYSSRTSTPKTTNATIYLVKSGNTGGGGAGSGPVNKNNIQASEETYHAHLFGHYPAGSAPEPGWILNYPRGFYLGSVFPGWSVDLVARNASGQATPDGGPGYMFGMIWKADGSPWGCGWLEQGTVKNPDSAVTTNNPCANSPMAPGKQSGAQDNRDSFGKDFDCAADESTCNGPISIDLSGLNPACTDKNFYKNYFYANVFIPGKAQDPVGTLDLSHNDQLRYRYTTKDGLMAVVAAPDAAPDGYGWGFISKDCIKGLPVFPPGTDHDHYVWTAAGPEYRP